MSRRPRPLALDHVKVQDRGAVVTKDRAFWKLRHRFDVSDRMVRFTRFIWMRDLETDDAHKLNASLLGAALRMGLIGFTNGHMRASEYGKQVLERDRGA